MKDYSEVDQCVALCIVVQSTHRELLNTYTKYQLLQLYKVLSGIDVVESNNTTIDIICLLKQYSITAMAGIGAKGLYPS